MRPSVMNEKNQSDFDIEINEPKDNYLGDNNVVIIKSPSKRNKQKQNILL